MTQGQPVIVLSVDVECHTGIHNYPFPTRKSFPDLPQTPWNGQIYDAVTLVVSLKLGRKCTVLNRGLVVRKSITLSTRPQLLLAEVIICCFQIELTLTVTMSVRTNKHTL